MPNVEFLIAIALGTALMAIPTFLVGNHYRMPKGKILLTTCILTVFGVIGTYLLFYVENGQYGGRSFYGAVFLVPILFLPTAKLLKLSYGQVMDLCAPAECAMLALMRILCMLEGCCMGKNITLLGKNVTFPSREIEFLVAVILCVVLIVLSRKEKQQGKLYPWYLVLYGATRLVLNFFRERQSPFLLGLAPGALWSICAVLIGSILLAFLRKKEESH